MSDAQGQGRARSVRLSLILAVLAALDLALGFGVQWYTLAVLGAGRATDALFAGMAIPHIVLATVTGSLTHVLVPLLSGPDDLRNRRNAWFFFMAVGGFFAAFALVAGLASGVLVPLVVPGFSAEEQALTRQLTCIQLVGMVFSALSSVLWSSCHARQEFLWAETSPLVGTVASLVLSVAFLRRWGVVGAAWFFVVRAALPALLLAPSLGRFRRPHLDDPVLSEAYRRVRPLVVGSLYFRTEVLVDRALPSFAPAGGLSLFYFAQQIFSAATHVVNKAVAAPMVPLLAEHAREGRWDEFARVYRRRLVAIVAAATGVYLATIALGRPTFELLFRLTGNKTEGDAKTLVTLLACLFGWLIASAAAGLSASAFYASGETRVPTRIGVATYTGGLGLKAAGFAFGSVYGLALGTSLYWVVYASALAIAAGKQLRSLNTRAGGAAVA